jgi:hypothetical protein
MPELLNPTVYGLWAGKQSAQGTPNTTPGRRFKQVGGDWNISRSEGSEDWSDLTKYGSQTDYINGLTGQGEPGIEATPEELAWLLWAAHGGETTAAVAGPPAKTKHTFQPSLNRPHWVTFFKRIGLTSLKQQQQFNDCLIGRVQIEASTANKVVRVTPRALSLDPAEVKTADPAAALPTKRPFIYTEGSSTFTVDAVVQRGHSQFTFVIDEDLSPVYGDDAVPHDVQVGNPSASISCTILFDAAGLARYNFMVYGTSSPAAGTKPIRTLQNDGSYEFTMAARDGTGALTGDKFKLTIPAVHWQLPDAPNPNPGGGTTELALAGNVRPPAAGQPYTIDIDCDAAAFTT